MPKTGYPDPRFDRYRKPVAISELTDASTIQCNALLFNTFRVILGGNRTLGNLQNPIEGETYTWIVIQDGDGGRTLTPDTAYDIPTAFQSSGNFDLDTTAYKVTVIRGIYLQSKVHIFTLTKGIAYTPPPFAIETLTELKAWIRSVDISGVSDGDTLTTISPPSVSTGLPSFTASNLKYAASVTGKPAINANNISISSTRRLVSSSITISSSFSIFFVIQFDTSIAPMAIDSGSNLAIVARSTANPNFRVSGTTGNASGKQLSNGWTTGSRKLVTWECDGTHAGQTVRINGVDQTLTNDTETFNPGTTSGTATVGFFGNGISDGYAAGNNYLFDIVVCSPKLGTTNRSNVEQTLANANDVSI